MKTSKTSKADEGKGTVMILTHDDGNVRSQNLLSDFVHTMRTEIAQAAREGRDLDEAIADLVTMTRVTESEWLKRFDHVVRIEWA